MTTRYMNPYLAGLALGLLLVATIFITGRGLGASGAHRSAVTALVLAGSPDHAKGNDFYHHESPDSPLKSWLVFEVIGVLLGGFVSGVVSDRLSVFTERPAHVTARRRLAFALAGGALFGVGAQFARGCTSGSALSGMAVMSVGGVITMFAIFGAAYAVAFFFRRLWLPGPEAGHGSARS